MTAGRIVRLAYLVLDDHVLVLASLNSNRLLVLLHTHGNYFLPIARLVDSGQVVARASLFCHQSVHAGLRLMVGTRTGSLLNSFWVGVLGEAQLNRAQAFRLARGRLHLGSWTATRARYRCLAVRLLALLLRRLAAMLLTLLPEPIVVDRIQRQLMIGDGQHFLWHACLLRRALLRLGRRDALLRTIYQTISWQLGYWRLIRRHGVHFSRCIIGP